jgi:hypothetical protein
VSGNTGQAVGSVQKRLRHPMHKWMAATWAAWRSGSVVFEAKFMLP